MSYLTEYRCVQGHDKCGEMLPGPECPYCEKRKPQRRPPISMDEVASIFARAEASGGKAGMSSNLRKAHKP